MVASNRPILLQFHHKKPGSIGAAAGFASASFLAFHVPCSPKPCTSGQYWHLFAMLPDPALLLPFVWSWQTSWAGFCSLSWRARVLHCNFGGPCSDGSFSFVAAVGNTDWAGTKPTSSLVRMFFCEPRFGVEWALATSERQKAVNWGTSCGSC